MYFLLKYLPRRRLSRLVGKLAYLPLPSFIATPLIRGFARGFKIDLTELVRPVESYRSIGEFFIRDLRPGVRPIGSGLVSPVDGTITEFGPIEQDRLLQIKGKTFSLGALFCQAEIWQRFQDGYFVTIYLSPRDYHHIHAPAAGEITESLLIPGDLWPVNSWSIRSVDDLFAINERLAAIIETSSGPIGVMMVGATNVGAISAQFDNICTNRAALPSTITPVLNRYSPGCRVEAGERIATFRLGSTVILLFPKGVFQPNQRCRPGTVKLGESLGGL